MKLVVSSSGETLADPVDLRFGRARFFLLVDTETGAASAHANTQNLNAVQGAGIQSAATVAGLGAEAVITGHVGPKAFRALSSAGIGIFLASGMSVQSAVDAFLKNGLARIDAPSVEGHWG